MIPKIDRSTIKAQARLQLKGKIWMTFLCMLITILISAAASVIPSRVTQLSGSLLIKCIAWLVYAAVTVLVICPVSVGLYKLFLNITYGRKPSVGTLFEPFALYYCHSILTQLYLSLIAFLWYLPFLIGSVIIGVILGITMAGSTILKFISGGFDFAGGIMAIIWYIVVLYAVILLLAIPYSIIMNAYAQTTYVLCEHPGMTPTQCVAASKAMMRGRKWELFVLYLSFIPWILLVMVTFGIAWIYVGPYMSVTVTNFYHRIKGGFTPAASYTGGNNPGGGYSQPAGTFGQAPAPGYGQPVYPAQGYAQTPVTPAPGYGQTSAPSAPEPPQSSQSPDPFAAFAAQASDAADPAARQALDQISHDMMTNFDDYTVGNDDNT